VGDKISKEWEAWGQIVANPKMVYSGANTMLTTKRAIDLLGKEVVPIL
jgi:hypothetical protein